MNAPEKFNPLRPLLLFALAALLGVVYYILGGRVNDWVAWGVIVLTVLLGVIDLVVEYRRAHKSGQGEK